MYDSQMHPGGALVLDQRERKFLLDGQTAFSFWQVASTWLQPDHRDDAHPVGYVRTTYFDTADFDYYRSCTGPVASRLRVREYAVAAEDGLPVLTGYCVLELKQSANGRRRKSRIRMAPDEVDAYLAELGDRPLSPCLTTWYQRAELTDASERLRVTLDTRICFCAPMPLGAACAGCEPPHVLARGPAFVLEVKLWDEPPAWLTRALRGFEEAVGFSKFVAGMQAAEECGLIR